MVGRCISYWNSTFLGDMLVFGRVYIFTNYTHEPWYWQWLAMWMLVYIQETSWWKVQCLQLCSLFFVVKKPHFNLSNEQKPYMVGLHRGFPGLAWSLLGYTDIKQEIDDNMRLGDIYQHVFCHDVFFLIMNNEWNDSGGNWWYFFWGEHSFQCFF